MHDRARRQRGSAILEFALVVPIFTLLAAGTITFGHALFVRSAMTNAAMVAARAGALGAVGLRTQGAARAIVEQRMGPSARSCAPLIVTVNTVFLLGAQRTFEVTVECVFRGGVGN